MTDCVPGIIIKDIKNRVLSVQLRDILEEVHDGATFYWNILEIDAMGDIGDEVIYGFHQEDYQEEINESKNGFIISWDKLKLYSSNIHQIMDGIIISSKNKSALHRYENELEMCETCDITLIMFDCYYWKIYSKNEKLIEQFAKKFNDIILIDSSDKKWHPLF